ncbi:Ribonuclease BN [Paenibacillus sp. CECT 9249]|uniref:MBL fold metallo-hydrolase n=1 Tax=Paenibacillus sp. CECT 9249 TaxID=2845385 RepID=UPI001E6039C7|nr:MBL fold metallo-hydrolase [Paenibacillus sp. CECT 9249]CAH0117629.1 Ribonuclease BN [Paenibacillus sp. CECT 9249]
MELILMGTACAACGVDRDNTYLLFRDASGSTLVDVGGNPLGKLKKLDITTGEIKRIIFTHFHTDHVYGLPSLLWGMWMDGRAEALDIYCASACEATLRGWLEALQTGTWPILFDIRIHTFDWERPAEICRGGDLAISSFPSLHAGPTVGLKIAYKDRTIVYSADTMLNASINEVPRVDLLVHEATTAREPLPFHSSLQGVAGYYDMGHIDRIVLVHVTDREPYEEVLEELPEEKRAKISIASDLQVFSFD